MATLPMEKAGEASERGRQADVDSELRLTRGAARQDSAAQICGCGGEITSVGAPAPRREDGARDEGDADEWPQS